MRKILFALPLLLIACSGTMTGQIRGTGERVQFNYEQGLDHDIYTSIIGSERFSGKAIMDGSSSTYATAFGGGISDLFGTSTTNRFVAVLLGDKGSSLNCRMRYADSSGFTTSGGVGECRHSDGRIIDIVW
ncbi:hypothetical protein [Pacificibacter sp.]|uniref:hypothetical protein n=1 Tax=Pacificibacter sp. TaxID=1917866 RepID=UPI00321B36A9